MRNRWPGIGLVAATVLAAGLMAQDKAADKEKKAAPPPDEKAQMEAIMKAGTPGDAHKKLEPLVGTFDAKNKSWMDPTKPPLETTGKEENKWVLGNRFVEMHYDGTFMGQPYSGMGQTGYDNVKKRYFSTWMDTMSTAIMMTTAPAPAKGSKTMTFTGTMDDPMTRKPMKLTEKITIADNDHHTLEMWGPGPDGKPYKMMEIEYTRKK